MHSGSTEEQCSNFLTQMLRVARGIVRPGNTTKAFVAKAVGADTSASRSEMQIRNSFNNPINGQIAIAKLNGTKKLRNSITNPRRNPVNNPIYCPITRRLLKRRRDADSRARLRVFFFSSVCKLPDVPSMSRGRRCSADVPLPRRPRPPPLKSALAWAERMAFADKSRSRRLVALHGALTLHRSSALTPLYDALWHESYALWSLADALWSIVNFATWHGLLIYCFYPMFPPPPSKFLIGSTPIRRRPSPFPSFNDIPREERIPRGGSE